VFKALELSTTVVRLELLSAFVLRQEAYGYVIFSFFNQRYFPENSSIGCRSLACEAISLSASRRIPFSRVFTWLGVCSP